MKIDKEHMLLYVVTDRTWLGGKSLSKQIEDIIKAGATCIQLREKDISFYEFLEIAREIKAVTDKYRVPFLINDNVEVALAVDADGVHVGQNDDEITVAREKLGIDKIIGVSAHTVEEALIAQENGADYIGVGAVFSTSTKLDANTVPMDVLEDISEAVDIPVVAIGGINKKNILELSQSGIHGVALISAIFSQKNISEATKELLELSKIMVYGG